MSEISWIDSWRRAMLGSNYGYNIADDIQFQRGEPFVEVVRAPADQMTTRTTFEDQLGKIESFLLKCIDELEDERQDGVSDIDEPQSGFSHSEIPDSQSRVANPKVGESPFRFKLQTRWGKIEELTQEFAKNTTDQTLVVEEEQSQDCENGDFVIPPLSDFTRKDSTPSTPKGDELIKEPLKFMGDLHLPSKEHQNHVNSLQRSTTLQIGDLQKSFDDEMPCDQTILGTLAKEIHHQFRKQPSLMHSEFLKGNHQFPSLEFPEIDVNLKVQLVCDIVLVDSRTRFVASLNAQHVFDVMSRRRATMKVAIVDHSFPWDPRGKCCD